LFIKNASLGIGVTGTHGKTTSTSMLWSALDACGLDPTVFVGTGSSCFGSRDVVLAELCEYHSHFLASTPRAVLLTNMEWEHVDAFADFEAVSAAYFAFLSALPEGAVVVYCHGNLPVGIAESRPDLRYVSYGFEEEADVVICDRSVKDDGGQRFVVDGRLLELAVSGRHNALNACGSYLLCRELGLPLDDVVSGLRAFVGCARRLEDRGELVSGVQWFDDYGHHPTEIETTLSGLREMYRDRRLICVFQAHTYSRTAAFLQEFGQCFGSVDRVYVSDIFASARELPVDGVSGDILAAKICENSVKARYIPSFEEIAEELQGLLEPGDVLVTMGAGVAYKVGEILQEAKQTSARRLA